MKRKFSVNNISRWVILLVAYIGWVTSVHAQEVYEIKEDIKEVALTEYLQVYHDTNDLHPNVVLDIMDAEDVVPELKSTSFGFSMHYYWLRLRIKNTTSDLKESVIVITNPHLDFVKIWSVEDDDNLSFVYFGGDGMPFNNRTVQNRNIVLPLALASQETKTLLIQVDKRNASVSVPISYKTKEHFEEMEDRSLYWFGIYFGILLLIIVFSLFIFFLLRQVIIFWYAFYLTFLGLYLIAHIGLLFQIGYPESYWYNDFSRPVFITLSTTALIHFIRLLLNIEKLLPKWNWVYNALIIILCSSTFYWLITPWWHDVQSILYLNVQNITLLISLLVVLISSILTYKKQKVVVMFFLIAFLAVLSAGMSIILIESGLIDESIVSTNPLFIGSMIEAIVFAFGLSYWSRVNNAERVKLLDMVQKSKKQMIDSYIKGIEVEKSKIAADLHDDIGSRLSHFKRQVEKEGRLDPVVIERIAELNKKIRKLSHELAPPTFKESEFLISLKHLVFTHRTEETEINLNLFDIPRQLDVDLSKQLYRIIQSALSSIERHAKATQVDIQFFYHNDELVLAIEDNGIGFNYSPEDPGLTLKNVLSRVELINGVIDISSSKRHGTAIMINVPI